jgi:C4-dicarboxylate-specific signal transduction histidine kinase
VLEFFFPQALKPNVRLLEVMTYVGTQLGRVVERERATDHIQQQVAERTAALEQAYRDLQQNQKQLLITEKMASLGRLTAGIAHEMNTPLAAVRSAAASLQKLVTEYQASIGDPQVTPDDHRAIAHELQENLQLAQTAAEHAAGFVRGIKLQTRDLAPHERRRFNAVPIIQQALLLLSHDLRKGGHTVRFKPELEVVELYGSPSRLAQVVTNMATNAIDAMADQGGGTLFLDLTPNAGGVQLAVRDTGCGVAPENLGRIFDPMFTTKPFGQGTGLGLTIVHDIVTGDFGGTVNIASQPGQGTTFTLQFAFPSELEHAAHTQA